jgi:hypothetical protein
MDVQRGLSCTIPTDDSNQSARRDGKGDVVQEQFVSKPLGQTLQFTHGRQRVADPCVRPESYAAQGNGRGPCIPPRYRRVAFAAQG